MSEVGFEINDPITIGDMSDVKSQKTLTPQAQNVKVRVAKASVAENKAKDLKYLKLELRIVDGIPMKNEESGELVMKYANKPLFTSMMDLVVWADMAVKGRDTKNWWKTKQHQVELVNFLKAIGADIKNVQINDAFLEGIVGAECAVDIVHEANQALDGTTGEYKDDGTFRERLRNFKKAS